MSAQIPEWEAFEKAHRIVVKSKLTTPHPIIWETARRIGFTVDAVTCAPPADDRWFQIDVAPERAEPALCIADALVKACELRGFELRIASPEHPDRGIVICIDGDPLSVSLSDKGHPSARLSLKASYRTWNDRLSRPLAKQLNSILLTLRKIVATSQRLRRETEEEERHMAELHRARDELRAQVEAERKAVEQLYADAANWELAQSIRAYIAAVEAKPVAARAVKDRAAWATWARMHAQRLDPLCKSPSSVLDMPYESYRELHFSEILTEDGSIDLG